MNLKKTILLTASLWLSAMTTLPLFAQEDDSPWHLGIALGAGQRSNPLVNSDDININAVVDVAWYGKRFFFDNGDLGFLLHESDRFAVNLVATYNNEREYYSYLTGKDLGLNILESLGGDFRFSSVAENDQVQDSTSILIADDGGIVSLPSDLEWANDKDLAQALADTELPGRDTAINSGLEFLYTSPWGDVQAQLLTDVSNTHDGQEGWLSWTRPWYIATGTGIDEISLTLGLEWKSGDLVTYYYGVRPEEAFPGRPAYSGGSGTNTFIRLSANHAFSPHWKLVSVVEREFLSKAIKDSPIVTEDAVDTFFVGLFYRF